MNNKQVLVPTFFFVLVRASDVDRDKKTRFLNMKWNSWVLCIGGHVIAKPEWVSS